LRRRYKHDRGIPTAGFDLGQGKARPRLTEPRGDWRMPSDASERAWLADLERVPAGD
jgi:hypothetical protein